MSAVQLSGPKQLTRNLLRTLVPNCLHSKVTDRYHYGRPCSTAAYCDSEVSPKGLRGKASLCRLVTDPLHAYTLLLYLPDPL
ncbi:hypothetical protein FKM82_019981 [Ascaphus truei]